LEWCHFNYWNDNLEEYNLTQKSSSISYRHFKFEELR
jgi:hypothetical protein